MNKNRVLPYFYISPFIIMFLLFFAIPAVYSLVLSFYKYKGYGTMVFVGLDNYKSLLSYGAFWKSVRNTLFYFITHLLPVMAGAFLIAAALRSKAMQRMQKIFKPVLFLPQVVPAMATTLIFKIIFSTRSGVINQMFHLNIPWLDNRSTMRWIVVLLIVWRSLGWFMVVFLSGLTTINNDLYEAADIDGASAWQRLVKITVPLMKPFFLFAFIMDTISSFKIYTEPNLLVASEAKTPVDVAPMMNMVTNNIRSGSFGMASAAGWLLFLVILIISMIGFGIMRNKE